MAWFRRATNFILVTGFGWLARLGGSVARLQIAWYGHGVAGSCATGTFSAADAAGADVTSAVAEACVGRSCCFIECSNAVFGDPLVGVPKQCSVQLLCTGQLEACDDGNADSGDGCNSACAVEAGYGCNGGSAMTPDTCGLGCGDSVLNATTEACDDGNAQSGDGCSSTCAVEAGFVCRGGNAAAYDACVTALPACDCGSTARRRAASDAAVASALVTVPVDFAGDDFVTGRDKMPTEDGKRTYYDVNIMRSSRRRAVYISLPQHVVRRAALLPHLQAAGFGGAEHFVAVDGRRNPLLTSALLSARIISPRAAETLLPGQKGVLASHFAVWQQAVLHAQRLDEWLFVFEDDARFHPLCTPEELARRLGTLPLDAWFLKLAYLCDSSTVSRCSGAAHPCNKDWHSLRENTFSALAYAVRVEALPKLLQRTRNGPVDCEMPFGDGVYGAASFSTNPEFYDYFNPILQRNETFYGVCGVAPVESSTWGV